MLGMASMVRAMEELSGYVTEGQPLATYMKQVGWVKLKAGGLALTPLGRALAAGLGVEGPAKSESEERGVVLNPDDPAKYELLVRALAGARGGMLADPYLSPNIFDLLAEGTSLRRLLLSKKVKTEDRTLFALGLARSQAATPDRAIEIRWSSDDRFHDRYLLHEDSLVGCLFQARLSRRRPDATGPRLRSRACLLLRSRT